MQGTGGVHLEHLLHGRDVGRVEVERMVEHFRELPSNKKGGIEYIGGRWDDAACKARAECTLNIATMRVTRDVSKFNGWFNAFASCQESRGGHVPVRCGARYVRAGCGGDVGAAGRPRI